MKFFIGALALVAATSTWAEGYAPYPVTNGVPDYGSDAYREYSSRMDEEHMRRSLEKDLERNMDDLSPVKSIDAYGGHDVIDQYGVHELE